MGSTTKVAVAASLSAALGAIGCSGRAAPPQRETPTLNVTHWTYRTELYMEYPPLVGGHAARFAVHLTKLDDFHALTAGVPSLEFTAESGGSPAVLRGSPPSRPGAFSHRRRTAVGRTLSMGAARRCTRFE